MLVYGTLKQKVSPKQKHSRLISLNQTADEVQPANYSTEEVWLTWAEYCSNHILLISMPSLGVYYCQQLTLSVCLSVKNFKLLFLFCFSMEPSHFFGRQFSMTPSTKCCSSIFDLGPLMPKIYSPKFQRP